MPSAEELRELAIKIFYEENPEATTNPEDYELKAPEGYYYLKARSRAMSGIKEELYRALSAYEEEVSKIVEDLKQMGEAPTWPPAAPEELEEDLRTAENQLSNTRAKLESAQNTIAELNMEQQALEEKIEEAAAAPEPITEKEVETEKQEHPQLTEKEAETLVKQHHAKAAKEKGIKEERALKIPEERDPTVTEPTRRRERALRRRPTPEKILTAVNADIMTMFTSTIHMLEETLRSGKLNPAQGILGMIMVADLLHGGAYTVPINERPALVGENSPYYGGDNVGPTNFYPAAGFNIFDIFSSILQLGNSVAESKVGAGIAQEVYMNGNVPHKFPKLLSDEAYAKILVMSMYLSTSELTLKNALGVKTFVEGESRLITAEAGAAEKVAGSVKQLTPLLSTLEGA